MSVLPSGQSLRQIIPDYDELLHDPSGYLQAGTIVIGPRQMYGLAGMFGLAAAGCFGYSMWLQQFDPEAVSIGIGLALGAMIWLGWSLLMRGHELTLLPEGVEIKYRDTVVWCPWRLFNAGGTPFVPDADNPRSGLTLPVDPEAIPFVVLRRDEAPIAHGVEVKARQFHFTGANEVVLPARYELRADDLGVLLLQLGRRLGHVLPKGSPPPEAYHLEDLEAETLAEPDGAGWITTHLTHLAFPPRCCSCLADTRQTMRFHVDAQSDRFLQIFTQQVRGNVLPIPVCENCQAAIRRQQNQVSSLMMPAGALMGLSVLTLFALLAPINDGPTLLILGLLAVSAGAMVGFLFGVHFGRRLPAELRHYSPTQGTVSIRFRNPQYGLAVSEQMRQRMRAARRPIR